MTGKELMESARKSVAFCEKNHSFKPEIPCPFSSCMYARSLLEIMALVPPIENAGVQL